MAWQWQGKIYETRAALDEAKRRYYEATTAQYRAQHLVKSRQGDRVRREAAVPARRRHPAALDTAMRKQVAPPQPAPKVAPPQPAVATKPEKPDDLTRIRGIGGGMQYRLNRGGVWTFAQLARLTPEEVYELTGIKVEWVIQGQLIEHAKELAQEAESSD